MNLTQLWSKLITPRPKKERNFYSIVLLLREPTHSTQQELEEAGERACGHPFNTCEDSPFLLRQDGDVTLIKYQSFLINLLESPKPYTPPNREELLAKADERGKLAWHQHTAWIAFDLLNDYDFTAEEGFATLARWAQQFLSPNCTAAFIPSMGKTATNNGVADRALKILIDLGHKDRRES